MIRLFILVEDVTAVMGAGYTHIRVYTDVAETGAFATLDGSTALVAGQESYEYTDLDGTDVIWYKTAYWGAVPGLSDKSAARRGETSSAYATVKELRAHIDKTATVDDWELAQILDAATRSINRFCGRPDGFVAIPTATQRQYPGSAKGTLRIDECCAVTGVQLRTSATDTWQTLVAADYNAATGDAKMPHYNTTPYTLLVLDPNGDYSVWYKDGPHITVRVTATWGFSVLVPDDIREACIAQAARWYKRGQSAWSDALASGELGMLLYRQQLDPDVKQILVAGRYVKPTVGRRY